RLDPTTLLVRSGQSLSDSPAKLTLDHRGKVRVRYDGSDPQRRLHANDELEVNFVAPITSVGFDAAPQQIPLIDSADIIVKLYDNNHDPVNTDQERNVSFELNSSNGSLEQKSISIKPGTF